MTEPSGSRWFVPLYEGLVEARHQKQMGRAIWLYLYCIKYALVANNGGQFRYSHIEAASELGMEERSIRRWFCTLQEYGYIEYRARKPYHLEIAVSNWRTVKEWKNTGNGDRTHLSGHAGRERTDLSERTDKRTDIFGPSYIIAYSPIAIHLTVSQSDEPKPASMADVFRGLLAELKKSKNRPATLRQIYKLCFGGDDDSLPDYGYLGRVAKKVGGAERFAQIMWELTTRPPADPIGYIMKVNGKGASNATRRRDTQADRRRGKVPESHVADADQFANAPFGSDG